MPALDYWHPVLERSQLKDKPVGVKVWDTDIVLFRTSKGVAALEDRCPHRFMRLSKGWVEGDKVVCPYHLWKYDGEGKGTSPCNPAMKPRARRFDATEYNGAIWVKPAESAAKLPEMNTEGYSFLGITTGEIKAPFELVIDNFIEIEHSPTNHAAFAFDAEAIAQVTAKVETLKEHIHVIYEGRQRKAPWWSFAEFFNVKAGGRLLIDFTVHFNPVYFIYNMTWHDPKTDKPLSNKIREFAFLTPRSKDETGVIIFFYSTMGIFKPTTFAPLRSLVCNSFLKIAHNEFLLDKNIVEGVAGSDRRTDLKGMQLGRFDRVLRDTRKLAASVYHAGPEAAPVADPPAPAAQDAVAKESAA